MAHTQGIRRGASGCQVTTAAPSTRGEHVCNGTLMMNNDTSNDLLEVTVDLVAAFGSHNKVQGEDMAQLISSTHAALAGLGTASGSAAAGAPEEWLPAVSSRKSLSNPEHILSMIDGKPYKSLKRHLSARGLTPQAYRDRYKLPSNYPMVAPAYSEQRREVAKRLGLGRKPRAPDAQSARAPRTPAPQKDVLSGA